jgi:hypothetical protein
VLVGFVGNTIEFANSRGSKRIFSWLQAVPQAVRKSFLWYVLPGILLTAIAPLSIIAAPEPGNRSPGDVEVSGGKEAGPPDLVFACDGPTGALESLFSEPGVISNLKDLKAGIAVALPDLSADRARLVHQLNQAGIPVTAWLALPGDEGYYLNAGNAPEAAARFADFKKWSAAHGLRWAAIGLDIEPSIQEFAALRQGSKWHLALTLIGRYFDWGRVHRAKDAYSALIRQIQTDGYQVETYQFPFIADERKVRTTLLERLVGIVDVRGDLEVLMTYTSFNHKLDSALIDVYGPDAQGVAVGVTSGSGTRFASLNWEEFSRDLMVANHFSHVIGVYNLEGCVRQGFLPRLKTVNWNEPVTIPAETIHKATQLRSRVQTALWIGSYLPCFIAAILLALTWIIVRWKRRRNFQREAGDIHVYRLRKNSPACANEGHPFSRAANTVCDTEAPEVRFSRH